ncbi:putative signal peptide protein [Puccinia sorghi]|uniref:Putative signal peptide protein n=1 Tax=Puccinia sorghi TaxID=27349 RepID=A0A0L6V9S3_9BASI|nr:putative signal peptide protein [Puccinia sorghi]
MVHVNCRQMSKFFFAVHFIWSACLKFTTNRTVKCCSIVATSENHDGDAKDNTKAHMQWNIPTQLDLKYHSNNTSVTIDFNAHACLSTESRHSSGAWKVCYGHQNGNVHSNDTGVVLLSQRPTRLIKESSTCAKLSYIHVQLLHYSASTPEAIGYS